MTKALPIPYTERQRKQIDARRRYLLLSFIDRHCILRYDDETPVRSEWKKTSYEHWQDFLQTVPAHEAHMYAQTTFESNKRNVFGSTGRGRGKSRKRGDQSLASAIEISELKKELAETRMAALAQATENARLRDIEPDKVTPWPPASNVAMASTWTTQRREDAYRARLVDSDKWQAFAAQPHCRSLAELNEDELRRTCEACHITVSDIPEK